MTVTGDLLSAAGLLLAVVGTLFSVWYGEMTDALNTPIAIHRAGRAEATAQTNRTLRFRGAPLVVAAGVLCPTLAPPAINTVWHAATDDFGHAYDPIKTIFVLVWLFTAALVAGTGQVALGLLRHLSDLRRPH